MPRAFDPPFSDVYHAAVSSSVAVGSNLRHVYKVAHETVKKAILDIENIIGPALVKSGLKVVAQSEVDDFLRRLYCSSDRDGSENKGATLIYGLRWVVMCMCNLS